MIDVKNAINFIKEFAEEITTEDELECLFKANRCLIAYDGFEPSGNVHIAQAIMKTVIVNNFTKMGIKFKILIADWHAWANNKLGGDLDKIQTTGKYFIEVWKACGMKLDNVEFIWASDLVKDSEYWKLVMQIAINNNLKRIIRCSQIMGREETSSLTAAQIFYPCMQCADIFYLEADICQLGMDQRKVNMLAREMGPKLGFYKPITVHHHMLMGLLKPLTQEKESLVEKTIRLKMSKSIPDSAIFVTDTKEEIKRKINKAYCLEGNKENNPILEYCRYIIFPVFGSMKIGRLKKYGGNIEFKSYNDLEKSFIKKDLFPLDLKLGVIKYLDEILQPVRNYFEENKEAKKLKEKVESFIAFNGQIQ